MAEIDPRIIKFFNRHHVLTLATSVDNQPWCANCFYVYHQEENCLVFTTDDDTRHGREFEINPVVSGSVVLETSVVGKIQGIQFQGLVSRPGNDLLKTAKRAYLLRFPVAALMNTSLWIISLTHIKMTDNRLGFGKKLVWKRD